MKNFILLIRKIRREIGTNLLYLLWSVLKVIVQTLRPTPRAIRAALERDRRTLLGRLDEPEALLDQARFYLVKPSGPARPLFEKLAAFDGPPAGDVKAPWQSAADVLAQAATMTWGDVDDPGPYLAFLQKQDATYFRAHRLNKGKNDYWEWYLVPWHRAYGRLTTALLDPRLRPYLLPVWKHYDRWYRDERPWMTRFTLGSNVASVTAGYALHGLMGFLLHDDAEARKQYLDRYVAYSRKLYQALEASFDADGEVSVPFEGVLYGPFWYRTAVILGLVQRALGLEHGLLDYPHLKGLPRYIWQSRTPDGSYQTSGDARLNTGKVPERSLYVILSQVHDDPYARKLADAIDEPHFLSDKIRG